MLGRIVRVERMQPTGQSYELSHGNQRAVVVQQGATLRSYSVDGVEVLAAFGADQLPDGCQGQHLMPWPNRIRDGRYLFEGSSHQLPLNEPGRGNAIHGLVSWLGFEVTEQTPSSVTQRVLLLPRPGWPGVCECTVRTSLSDQGLQVEVACHNVGEHSFPFGYAAHPYLRLPTGTVDEWGLCLPFEQWLETDERLLPISLHPTVGTEADFRAARALSGQRLDTAFTEPVGGAGWEASITHGGRRIVLWADDSMRWAQVYTPGEASIAIEPMSVGPDAFNPGPTHHDLTVLAPGQRARHRWGLRAEAL